MLTDSTKQQCEELAFLLSALELVDCASPLNNNMYYSLIFLFSIHRNIFIFNSHNVRQFN